MKADKFHKSTAQSIFQSSDFLFNVIATVNPAVLLTDQAGTTINSGESAGRGVEAIAQMAAEINRLSTFDQRHKRDAEYFTLLSPALLVTGNQH